LLTAWLSASPYGTNVVPVTVRDSTDGLDELCNSETELPIREHTTDTAGATEIIFALFDLLGYRFTPRLRGIGDRRLLTSGPIDIHRYPRLQPYVTGQIQRQRMLHWWDELLWVAGSLKLGWVTASLLGQKLQAYPQKNALTLVLQEYGRLVRTLPIMRWGSVAKTGF
jgi:TnpA family transposase